MQLKRGVWDTLFCVYYILVVLVVAVVVVAVAALAVIQIPCYTFAPPSGPFFLIYFVSISLPSFSPSFFNCLLALPSSLLLPPLLP